MTNYTITLSATENKALAYAALSQEEWIQNVVRVRCNAAIDEIVEVTVRNCLAEAVQVPSNKDAMVELAFEKGWVESAAERKARLEAEAAAKQGA